MVVKDVESTLLSLKDVAYSAIFAIRDFYYWTLRTASIYANMTHMVYSFPHMLWNKEIRKGGDEELFLLLILLFEGALARCIMLDIGNEPYVFPNIMQQFVRVSERTVLEHKAYMLFYVCYRRNTAPKKAY